VSRKKPSTETGTAGEATEPGPSPGQTAATSAENAADSQAAEPDAARRQLEEARRLLAEAQSRADGNLALLQRVAADYENYKKFAERERAEAVLRERSAMLIDFIDSMENLERAIEAGTKELPPESKLMKGLMMTLDLMKTAVERSGVKPIAARGCQFDPTLHEAVYFVPDQLKPEYSIADELRRGYTLNGKVLRTSKVCVVTHPAPAGKEPECPKDDKEA
jgi:molecular chaperone GrpE